MLNLKNVVDGHSKNMQQSKKNLQQNPKWSKNPNQDKLLSRRLN